MDRLLSSLSTSTEKAKSYCNENPGLALAGVSGVLIGGYVLYRFCRLNTTSDGRKSSLGLSLGKERNGAAKWHAFASSWSNGHKQAEGGTGSGVVDDPAKAASLANDFYSFVTDIYEWGWGASFHFAPKLWSHDWKAGEAAQEVRIAHMLRAAPGMKLLDVGCGVGGPMRIIAASTGAHVTGITISEYQVERCKILNKKAGMSACTDVVQGDFHAMPFDDNTFDAVFSVEATCHSGDLTKVYGEIFRVLKPGGHYVSQEWVSTKTFDPTNDEHKQIIEEINFGNSLPDMRSWDQAEAAGKKVGFHLVTAYDAAAICLGPNRPWYERLTQFRWLHYVDQAIIATLSTLYLLPKTLVDVHTMLVRVATSLVAGGESGIFTPMYMMCFEKPVC